MDVDAIFRQALTLHQAGRLMEAGKLYNQLLGAQPTHADALCLLGSIFVQADNLTLALDLINRAVTAHPHLLPPRLALGNALQSAGRAAEAEAAFRAATRLAPEAPHGWVNLASALVAQGRFAEAETAARTALELAPAMPEAFNNLGNALAGLGWRDEAAEAYGAALKQRPDFADALDNLGGVLLDMGEAGKAIDAYRRAVILAPDDARKRYQLGRALQDSDRLAEAAQSYMEALKLDPAHLDALNNLGCTFKDMELLDQAEACFRGGLRQRPDDVDLHWNLSLTLLQKGAMAEGWREYEWRWRTPSFLRFRRDFGKPEWTGEALEGRTLLVHAEQGFGDGIQFVRYLRLLAHCGGRVVLECRPQLVQLLAAGGLAEQVVGLGEELPAFDLHVPLMSLPRLFNTSLATVPAEVPYLAVPAGRAAPAQVARAPGLKVGLVWAGSPTRPDNHKRSIPAALLAPLAEVPGLSLFSLQVGPFAGEVEAIPGAIDLSPHLRDFADTAATVAALDLVVSVDTAVAHLAGALGKPCWVLLSRPTGFLWMQERSDSPWYPTLRLLRQPKPGQWEPVVAELLRRLGAPSGEPRGNPQ